MRAAAALLLMVSAASAAELKDGDVTPGGSTIIEGRSAPAEAATVTVEGVYHDVVVAHVERHFGPVAMEYREDVASFVRVNLLAVPPRADRPYWLFVTTGMSDRAMTVARPDRARLERAELMIALPADWFTGLDDIERYEEAQWYPLAALNWLARYPHSAATWFSAGHTIHNGADKAPVGPGAGMTAFMLDMPVAWPPEAWTATAADGAQINFYMIYPLYEDELAFKLERGSDELLDRLYDAGYAQVFYPARPSVAP